MTRADKELLLEWIACVCIYRDHKYHIGHSDNGNTTEKMLKNVVRSREAFLNSPDTLIRFTPKLATHTYEIDGKVLDEVRVRG